MTRRSEEPESPADEPADENPTVGVAIEHVIDVVLAGPFYRSPDE